MLDCYLEDYRDTFPYSLNIVKQTSNLSLTRPGKTAEDLNLVGIKNNLEKQ